ncbi:hypothetical protein CDAR_319461 [Caerostris darwini]|uniref:Uncharacterized protein n=1 Tax=Caerostris darwini TaxID=1538125 RepID=A0AAV4V930_9ARAC|nr:hypothetical protein CDAR_319461 [Caerostris darwini]
MAFPKKDEVEKIMLGTDDFSYNASNISDNEVDNAEDVDVEKYYVNLLDKNMGESIEYLINEEMPAILSVPARNKKIPPRVKVLRTHGIQSLSILKVASQTSTEISPYLILAEVPIVVASTSGERLRAHHHPITKSVTHLVASRQSSDLAGKNNCQYHSPQTPAGRTASTRARLDNIRCRRQPQLCRVSRNPKKAYVQLLY